MLLVSYQDRLGHSVPKRDLHSLCMDLTSGLGSLSEMNEKRFDQDGVRYVITYKEAAHETQWAHFAVSEWEIEEAARLRHLRQYIHAKEKELLNVKAEEVEMFVNMLVDRDDNQVTTDLNHLVTCHSSDCAALTELDNDLDTITDHAFCTGIPNILSADSSGDHSGVDKSTQLYDFPVIQQDGLNIAGNPSTSQLGSAADIPQPTPYDDNDNDYTDFPEMLSGYLQQLTQSQLQPPLQSQAAQGPTQYQYHQQQQQQPAQQQQLVQQQQQQLVHQHQQQQQLAQQQQKQQRLACQQQQQQQQWLAHQQQQQQQLAHQVTRPDRNTRSRQPARFQVAYSLAPMRFQEDLSGEFTDGVVHHLRPALASTSASVPASTSAPPMSMPALIPAPTPAPALLDTRPSPEGHYDSKNPIHGEVVKAACVIVLENALNTCCLLTTTMKQDTARQALLNSCSASTQGWAVQHTGMLYKMITVPITDLLSSFRNAAHAVVPQAYGLHLSMWSEEDEPAHKKALIPDLIDETTLAFIYGEILSVHFHLSSSRSLLILNSLTNDNSETVQYPFEHIGLADTALDAVWVARYGQHVNSVEAIGNILVTSGAAVFC
ncbi:hypothetical protein F4604DRAFT_1674542 [Suillus subluteus]|nr:hypothetical protein F4604DRAFT_1674542 [Suillus subluteus]